MLKAKYTIMDGHSDAWEWPMVTMVTHVSFLLASLFYNGRSISCHFTSPEKFHSQGLERVQELHNMFNTLTHSFMQQSCNFKWKTVPATELLPGGYSLVRA